MEIHVLPGTTSPDLRLALRFEKRLANGNVIDPLAKDYLDDLANHSDVTLSFSIADASVPPGTSVRSFAARGITLNPNTGEVTVSTLPALFPSNLLLEVQAISEPQTPREHTFRELIRIHVHRSIQAIWLTPNPLTVRPKRSDLPLVLAFADARFALRARFDDDVVGDITDWPESQIEWMPSIRFTFDGRIYLRAGDIGAAPIQVSARLRAHPGVQPATASLRVVDAWRIENPNMTRLVPGAGSANPQAIEAVPNVLFLPDGFPVGTEQEFFAYVNRLVHFIKMRSLCKPYDLLAHSINFWAAFVPSPSPFPGITWGTSVFTTQIGSLQSWAVDPLPRPERPHGRTRPWNVEHLIYEVGLPTPRDRFANTARTDDDVLDDLDTLFGATYRNHLPANPEERQALVSEWRHLGTHRILDDVDTPLGMMSGAPRVDYLHNLIWLNPDRMSREHLDDLLSALMHEDATTSGLRLNTLWTNPQSRNYDLVCLIAPVGGREMNTQGYFSLGQDPGSRVGTLSGVNDIVVASPTIRDVEKGQEPYVFAHELTHSFNLGDEYAHRSDHPLFKPDQELADRFYPNLQSPFTIKRANEIHGDEIKWRWHRIRWAAEIIGRIQDISGGMFEAPIRTSHASYLFPIGEIVHLRFRDIHIAFRDVNFNDQTYYLIKNPRLSVPLRLVENFSRGNPPVFHVKLRVDPTATANFKYPPGQTVHPGLIVSSFFPGSIVYCPTRAPEIVFDANLYPYAELIAKNIKDHIIGTRAPIGRPNLQALDSDVRDNLELMSEIPVLPAGLLRRDFPGSALPMIVGLYEGGMSQITGLFHPTGFCIMNRRRLAGPPLFINMPVPADLRVSAGYCHVCKYTLVDAIDPSKHRFIDEDYESIYPLK